jgi:hypothetical protein
MESQVEVVDDCLSKRELMLQNIKRNLRGAQHIMIQLANKHKSERSFAIGDLVYIKLQPYR